MLDPENFGIRRALHETVDVLHVGITLLLGRIVFGSHSASGGLPGFASVTRNPDASCGDADADVARIARIDANGVNAWPFRSVGTPFLALGMIPKRTIQLPRVAAVFRFEESSGHGSAPEDAGFVRASC